MKTFNSVYDGEDVIAQARTGTGKTFSFAIPLVEKLQKDLVELTRGRAPKVSTHPLPSLKTGVRYAVYLCITESPLCLFIGPGVDSNQRISYPGC